MGDPADDFKGGDPMTGPIHTPFTREERRAITQTAWYHDKGAFYQNIVMRYEETCRKLEKFVRSVERDWDCDEDAHKHGTSCRVCEAKEVLGESEN